MVTFSINKIQKIDFCSGYDGIVCTHLVFLINNKEVAKLYKVVNTCLNALEITKAIMA